MLTGKGAADGAQYNKPGFVCYLNHVVLVLYFPIVYAILLVNRGPGSFGPFVSQWCGNFSMTKALKEATLIAVVYWVCIWTWIVGLTYITVSASNALYQLQVRMMSGRGDERKRRCLGVDYYRTLLLIS